MLVRTSLIFLSSRSNTISSVHSIGFNSHWNDKQKVRTLLFVIVIEFSLKWIGRLNFESDCSPNQFDHSSYFIQFQRTTKNDKKWKYCNNKEFSFFVSKQDVASMSDIFHYVRISSKTAPYVTHILISKCGFFQFFS